MPKLTLSEAIAAVSWKLECSRDSFDDYRRELNLLLAAAKAFACERCGGNGWTLDRILMTYEDCPACAEFRRVAREEVEG